MNLCGRERDQALSNERIAKIAAAGRPPGISVKKAGNAVMAGAAGKPHMPRN
jgi:hypothetical protein